MDDQGVILIKKGTKYVIKDGQILPREMINGVRFENRKNRRRSFDIAKVRERAQKANSDSMNKESEGPNLELEERSDPNGIFEGCTKSKFQSRIAPNRSQKEKDELWQIVRDGEEENCK